MKKKQKKMLLIQPQYTPSVTKMPTLPQNLPTPTQITEKNGKLLYSWSNSERTLKMQQKFFGGTTETFREGVDCVVMDNYRENLAAAFRAGTELTCFGKISKLDGNWICMSDVTILFETEQYYCIGSEDHCWIFDDSEIFLQCAEDESYRFTGRCYAYRRRSETNTSPDFGINGISNVTKVIWYPTGPKDGAYFLKCPESKDLFHRFVAETSVVDDALPRPTQIIDVTQEGMTRFLLNWEIEPIEMDEVAEKIQSLEHYNSKFTGQALLYGTQAEVVIPKIASATPLFCVGTVNGLNDEKMQMCDFMIRNGFQKAGKMFMEKQRFVYGKQKLVKKFEVGKGYRFIARPVPCLSSNHHIIIRMELSVDVSSNGLPIPIEIWNTETVQSNNKPVPITKDGCVRWARPGAEITATKTMRTTNRAEKNKKHEAQKKEILKNKTETIKNEGTMSDHVPKRKGLARPKKETVSKKKKRKHVEPCTTNIFQDSVTKIMTTNAPTKKITIREAIREDRELQELDKKMRTAIRNFEKNDGDKKISAYITSLASSHPLGPAIMTCAKQDIDAEKLARKAGAPLMTISDRLSRAAKSDTRKAEEAFLPYSPRQGLVKKDNNDKEGLKSGFMSCSISSGSDKEMSKGCAGV